MDLVTRSLGTTGGILTFILAFTIVQASSELGRVAETVNSEARMISMVDRMLLHFDGCGDGANPRITRALCSQHPQGRVAGNAQALSRSANRCLE